jgi:hypothetical protein
MGILTNVRTALSWQEAQQTMSNKPTHYQMRTSIAGQRFSWPYKSILALYPDAPTDARTLLTTPDANGEPRAVVVDSLPWGCEPIRIDASFRMTPPPEPAPQRMIGAKEIEARFKRSITELSVLGFPNANAQRLTQKDGHIVKREGLWSEGVVDRWAEVFEGAGHAR